MFAISSAAGGNRAKRMFGEWVCTAAGVYFGCVCDNQLFIKPTATNVDLLARRSQRHPMREQKPCWRIEDLEEDRKTLASLVERTCAELKQGGKKRNGQEEFPWTEKDC